MLNHGMRALAAAAILIAAPALALAHENEGRSDVIRMNEINDLQIHCNQLMDQFDHAVKGRPATASVDQAKKLRAEAGKACLSPMAVDTAQGGVDKITEALAKIGLKPAVD